MLKVKKGEKIVLIDKDYKKYIISTDQKTDKYKGIGVFNPEILIGLEIGKTIEIGSKKFWILYPSLQDKLQSLKRMAQIILPRDSAQIIINCSIEPGHKVLEAGIGSGSLTISLASMVAPNGIVISYDTREDFIKHARNNLKVAELESFVITKLKDITTGIDEKDLDAVILDIPNPWDAVEQVYKSLKPGGYLCSYSPLSTQVEKTVREINKNKFIEVKTIENIQREIIVNEYGMRPSFNMLGHTGYMTFARKVLL